MWVGSKAKKDFSALLLEEDKSMYRSVCLLTLMCVLICSCKGNKLPETTGSMEEGKMQLKVESTAFKQGQAMPARYTSDGSNVSPPLAWSGVPAQARSIALICDDPDAPRGTWVHWVLFNLPANVTELSENIPAQETLSNGARHGRNDFGKFGYGGPAPPSGTHRYFFRVYALDTQLDLPAGAQRAELLAAMKGHIVAEGELMGTYSRR